MTNNVGMTMRQARPQYVTNGGLGSVMNGIGGLFGGAPTQPGQKKIGGMTPGNAGGTMTTMPVGSPLPVSGGAITTMPVGRPVPVNIRNATSTPMNPSGPTMMNPLGRGGVTLMSGNRLNPLGRGGVTLMRGNRLMGR